MLCFPRATATAGKAQRHGSVVACQDLVQLVPGAGSRARMQDVCQGCSAQASGDEQPPWNCLYLHNGLFSLPGCFGVKRCHSDNLSSCFYCIKVVQMCGKSWLCFD